MNETFNSQAPHFLTKVKTYCAKVLPLVFDNSLSYYEFLCKMCHKLNETIDALNAQNLNTIEFTHMVQLEIEKFEKYVDERLTNFENEMKAEWEEYKAAINAAFEEFKNQMRTEWEQEKEINKNFRENLLSEFNTLKADIIAEQERFENKIKGDFETFKNTVNAEIEQFEQATNEDLTAFKNTMQTQQNEFEKHMVELFNNFKTTEKQARTDFESNFQQLFEQWKVDTLNALQTQLSAYETSTTELLKTLINNQIQSSIDSVIIRINETNRMLQIEVDARQKAVNDLQEQINQLTPEGAIKVDTPDENGNSQLYKNDTTTGERVNIFPKVNIDETNLTNVIKGDETDGNGHTQLYKTDEATGGKVLIYPVVDETSKVKFLGYNSGVRTNSEYAYINQSDKNIIVHGLHRWDNENNEKMKFYDGTIIPDFLLIPLNLIPNIHPDSSSPTAAYQKLNINYNVNSPYLEITNREKNTIFLPRLITHTNAGGGTADENKVMKFVNYNGVDYLSIPMAFQIFAFSEIAPNLHSSYTYLDYWTIQFTITV